MLKLNVNNETSRLLAVVLGTAKSNGSTPKLEECYDPKSRQNVLNNTYPTEIDMINEMNQFEQVLLKYKVDIKRPETINNYNQIFSRDIAFVIDDSFIISNILPDRSNEILAINKVIDLIPKNKIIENYSKISTIYCTAGHSQMISYGLDIKIISLITHPKLKNFCDDIDDKNYIDINNNIDKLFLNVI